MQRSETIGIGYYAIAAVRAYIFETMALQELALAEIAIQGQ